MPPHPLKINSDGGMFSAAFWSEQPFVYNDSVSCDFLLICMGHFRGRYHPLKILNHDKKLQSGQKNDFNYLGFYEFQKPQFWAKTWPI